MSADEIDTEVWALFEECQELSTSTGQLEAEATEYKAKLWDRENSDYPWVQNPYRELRAQMGWAEPRSAMGDVEKAKSRRQKWQQTKASLTREKAEAAEKVKMAEKTFTRENSYFDENLALRRGLAAAREPLEGAHGLRSNKLGPQKAEHLSQEGPKKLTHQTARCAAVFCADKWTWTVSRTTTYHQRRTPVSQRLAL